MRTIILVASLLAVLAAAPDAYAAGSDATAATSGQPAKSKAKKIVKNGVTAGAGATTGTMSTQLTAAECTTLGGTVYEGGGFCKSDKYCGTTDENGNRHRVCIEVAQ
ncbi:MAG: hypothetical protein AB7S80_19645 [Rhizobiaceae bacterium]